MPLIRAGACWLALGLALAPTASAATIRSFGRYSFSALGAPTLKMSGSALTRGRSLTFVLPRGAKERPGHWYVLHLHALVELRRDSPPGKAYLDVVSGGYGSAKIAFVLTSPKGPVEWSALGIINGAERHRSATRRIEIRFANIMPLLGLHPGVNTLAFGVEQYGARISSVTIYHDSAIEYTPLGPGRLIVRAVANHGAVHVGERLVATLEVSNMGDRPAQAVEIRVGTAGEPMALDGRATRSRGTLRPGQRLFESFAFTGRQPGRTQIFFLVSSSANQPGVEIDVETTGQKQTARAASRHGTRATIIGALAASAAAAFAAALLFRRRRRDGRQRAE